MIVKHLKPEPAFSPVGLHITFQTKDELEAFRSVCNLIPIAEWLRNRGVEAGDLVDGKSADCGNNTCDSLLAAIKKWGR